MKKGNKFKMLLSAVLILLLAACGKQEIESSKMTEEVIEGVNVSNKDEVKVVEDTNMIEVVKDDEILQRDLVLTEYEQSYEDFSVELTGGSILEAMDSESFVESWKLSDSVNLYLDVDVCIGYTKPDIEITTSEKYDGWYAINVGNKVRYVKAEEIEAVATVINYNEEKENSVVEVPAQVETVTNNSVTESSVDEAPAVTASDKYTPEEAIAVYRSLMEAGGMTWNPSLKNGGSWGTGWIYLDKGMPEWTASTNLESARMGDSGGNPWTDYYLEVTGSDENAVYVTEWAD